MCDSIYKVCHTTDSGCSKRNASEVGRMVVVLEQEGVYDHPNYLVDFLQQAFASLPRSQLIGVLDFQWGD